MESVGVQEFSFRVAGIVGHPGINIYKMQVIGLFFYFLFDDLIGIADTIDDIPAADAGFDGDKGKGDIAELLAGAADQLLEENENLFGMAAVAEVVVAGVHDDGAGMEGGYQPVEKPVAGGERRSTEAQIYGLVAGEIFIQALPESDGRAAVKKAV